jgi:hypothetical protein
MPTEDDAHMPPHGQSIEPSATGHLEVVEFDRKIEALQRLASDLASRAEALFVAGRV